MDYHISELIKSAASPFTEETEIKIAKSALKDTDPLPTKPNIFS